ncbi:MAG: hypothetical protein IJ035_01120 [Oscillospiraceae bacterium]|nr:hypothetical protein [Oscillospiraceae bacterium]
MEIEMLKGFKSVAMPDEMKERIMKKCTAELCKKEENKMKKIFKKPISIMVAVIACICLSVTALAASGQLDGFLEDIKNWNGAITGQVYKQATEEIKVNVAANDNQLVVNAEFVRVDKPPYNVQEFLQIGAYKILDSNGKVVIEGNTSEAAEIKDGLAEMKINTNELESGSYTLVISSFVGSKKAEQPLEIFGNWVCEFEY